MCLNQRIKKFIFIVLLNDIIRLTHLELTSALWGKPFRVYEEKVPCYAIAINSENNLVVAGSGYNIKVIQITQDQTLNMLQLIQHHKQLVLCLSFFSKNLNSRSFISVADTIIIWDESDHQWNIQTCLKIEYDISQVKSLVIHPEEDLIIFGSQQTIQFWFQNLDTEPDKIQNKWICKPFDNRDTFGLSINQKGDKLVSCNIGQEILVLEGSSTTQWKVMEKISTNTYGLRLCFITNDIIAFQERGSRPHEFLQFYSLNSKEKLTQSNVKGGYQACNSLFPLSYVPQNNQLLIEMGIVQMLLRQNKQILNNLNQSQFNILNIKANTYMVQLVRMEIFQLFGMINQKQYNLEDQILTFDYILAKISFFILHIIILFFLVLQEIILMRIMN
ncbi:unnamed protein product [Paramecium pentaurelia]|uniref:Uncharacterized protein n=1 Tax=Paramecium pentaurelia TaxID=43138 RepID=A0A8S1X6I5_9CILI|nr:unnamed protein product [Paramecium pentaurelia]